MLVTRAILLTTIILACQPAFAQSPELIERGRQLFFNEIFEGKPDQPCRPAEVGSASVCGTPRITPGLAKPSTFSRITAGTA